MMNNNKNKNFVNERYKGHKKKSMFKKIVQVALFGLLVGVVAAVVFAFLSPILLKITYLEKDGPVVIEQKNLTSRNENNDNKNQNSMSNDKEKKDFKNKDDILKDKAKPTKPVIVEKTISLNIKDYKLLYNELNDIIEKIKKSTVEIIVEKKDDEQLLQTVKNQKNIGLIIAENKKSFFILTNYIKNSSKVEIKAMIGDTINSVTKVKHNDATSLMIVKLNKAELSKEQYDKIEVADLVLSNSDDLGKPIIFYGNICDKKLGYAYGSICSIESTNRFIDANYSMLMSTIPTDENSTGIIANLDGKIMGFIDKNSKTKCKEAFAISEIKSMIEKLSNAESIAILGIRGESVKGKNISKQIENGIFVIEVADKTPAMKVGILPGDVIVKVDSNPINNMQQLQNLLKSYEKKQNIKLTIMRQKLDKYEEMTIYTQLK